MEELSNILRLKQENQKLLSENQSINFELKILKEKASDSNFKGKVDLKVIELKMLIDKYKKEKVVLLKKIVDAENLADKRNEEILSALVNGSYGITFEDFILNLSETRFLKIPIDSIFNDIKNKVIDKFSAYQEKKNKELENLIQNNKKQAAISKNIKLQYETIINLKVNAFKKDYDKKISSQIELMKKKHNDQILLLKKEQVVKMEQIIEEEQKHDFILTLKIKYSKIKKEFEEVSKFLEVQKTSLNILKSENSSLKKENYKLSESLGISEIKLQNCQKELSIHLKKPNLISSPPSIQPNTGKMNIGIDSDGSKGWHDLAREDGKFGSLPSFDNYDDDYTDNLKEGFE